jgi:O-antigen/teichoic acid export membrane protein
VVPLAQLFGEGVAGAWLVLALRRSGIRVRPRLDWAMLRTVFRRASPIMLTMLLALAIYNADVLYLRSFRGLSDVGLYLAAYALINFLGPLGNVLTVSLLPVLGRTRNARDVQVALYHTAMARVVAIGLPLAVGGALLGGSIIDVVFGASFAPAGPVLALLIWSIPLLLARSVLMAVLISEGRPDLVLRITALAAGLNLGLNLLAVPLFGMFGAAVVTVLSELARMSLARLFVAHHGFPPTTIGRYLRPAVATAAMAVALRLVPGFPLPVVVAAGAAFYLTTLAALGGVRIASGRPTLTV